MGARGGRLGTRLPLRFVASVGGPAAWLVRLVPRRRCIGLGMRRMLCQVALRFLVSPGETGTAHCCDERNYPLVQPGVHLGPVVPSH